MNPFSPIGSKRTALTSFMDVKSESEEPNTYKAMQNSLNENDFWQWQTPSKVGTSSHAGGAPRKLASTAKRTETSSNMEICPNQMEESETTYWSSTPPSSPGSQCRSSQTSTSEASCDTDGTSESTDSFMHRCDSGSWMCACCGERLGLARRELFMTLMRSLTFTATAEAPGLTVTINTPFVYSMISEGHASPSPICSSCSIDTPFAFRSREGLLLGFQR